MHTLRPRLSVQRVKSTKLSSTSIFRNYEKAPRRLSTYFDGWSFPQELKRTYCRWDETLELPSDFCLYHRWAKRSLAVRKYAWDGPCCLSRSLKLPQNKFLEGSSSSLFQSWSSRGKLRLCLFRCFTHEIASLLTVWHSECCSCIAVTESDTVIHSIDATTVVLRTCWEVGSNFMWNRHTMCQSFGHCFCGRRWKNNTNAVTCKYNCSVVCSCATHSVLHREKTKLEQARTRDRL